MTSPNPMLDWLIQNGHLSEELVSLGVVHFPDGSSCDSTNILLPTVNCRHCGQILVIQVPGVPVHPWEYAQKVILHEETCQS